jgi:hypothetical protein
MSESIECLIATRIMLPVNPKGYQGAAGSSLLEPKTKGPLIYR